MPSTFQPGIPTGSVKLNVDYKNIQQNFQQLDTSFGIDHTTFSNQTAQNGYHTNVHMIPFSTTVTNPPNNQPVVAPANTPGYGQLFSAQINDSIALDEALYFLTGAGQLQQLTRNFVPVAANNGYTFIPGGLMVQWGQITGTNSSFTTLTFATANKAFPNNCFAIFTQPFGSGTVAGGTCTIDIRKSTISGTSFEWAMVTNSGQYTGFFWVAIGN